MYAAETVPHSITTQKYTIESYESYQLPIELLGPSHNALCPLPSFEDLPQAYIEANEFDCLRDEAIEYEKHLQQAGVKVMLIQTKGKVHGFELKWKSAYIQAIIRELPI